MRLQLQVLIWLGILLFATHASAQSQDNYTWDLSALAPGDQPSDFAPVGWGHIVSDYYGTVIEYSVNDGEISVKNAQGDAVGDYAAYSAFDLLVSPAVGGTVTLEVKKYGDTDNSSLYFYTCKKSGTAFTMGDMIEVTVPQITNDFQKVTLLDVPEGTYVGIRGSEVVMRNFTATKAGVVLKKQLSIEQVTSDNPQFIDMQADGTYQLAYSVTLRNTGDVDLTSEMENYTLSLLAGPARRVVYTMPIVQNMKRGETAESISLQAKIDGQKYGNATTFYLREDVSGSQIELGSITPVPYMPVLSAKVNGAQVANGATIDFGKVKRDSTVTVTIANDGAKSLVVQSVQLPEGFASDVTSATIEAHQSVDISVTLQASKLGKMVGDMHVGCTDGLSLGLQLTGIVVDKDCWMVDFSDQQVPVNMIRGSFSAHAIDNGNYGAYNFYVEEADGKMVSPRLLIAKGETFTVDVARYSASAQPTFAVYYSPDRTHWTLLKRVSPDSIPAVAGSYMEGYTHPFVEVVVDKAPVGEGYIALNGGYVYVDNLCGYRLAEVDHDISFNALVAPTGNMVNTACEFTIKAVNLGLPEKADGYRMELVVDGEKVAMANTVDWVVGDSKLFSFTFTPHKAGTFEAYAQFTAGEFMAKSAAVSFEVMKEEASKEVQIGEPSDKNYSYAPINTGDRYSASSIVYTAKDLALPAGTKITSVAFHGIAHYSLDMSNVKVWVEEIDEVEPSTSLRANKKDDCLVYDGVLKLKGDVDAYYDGEAYELFKLMLARPIVYNGKNLKITFETQYDDAGYYTAAFEATSSLQAVTMRGNDGFEPIKSLEKTDDAPVLYLGLEMAPKTISGRVTSEGKPVPNAEVTLRSGDVEYSGTTDAEGYYRIEVYRDGLTYTVSVALNGYVALDDETPVTFADNVTRDFSLVSTGVTSVPNRQTTADNHVYDLSGRRMNASSLRPGIYIKNGRKFVVR